MAYGILQKLVRNDAISEDPPCIYGRRLIYHTLAVCLPFGLPVRPSTTILTLALGWPWCPQCRRSVTQTFLQRSGVARLINI